MLTTINSKNKAPRASDSATLLVILANYCIIAPVCGEDWWGARKRGRPRSQRDKQQPQNHSHQATKAEDEGGGRGGGTSSDGGLLPPPDVRACVVASSRRGPQWHDGARAPVYAAWLLLAAASPPFRDDMNGAPLRRAKHIKAGLADIILELVGAYEM